MLGCSVYRFVQVVIIQDRTARQTLLQFGEAWKGFIFFQLVWLSYVVNNCSINCHLPSLQGMLPTANVQVTIHNTDYIHSEHDHEC